MSLSAASCAASSSSNSLVCVCPLVPSRPNSTVKELPSTVMAQNLFDDPSQKWNPRRLMASLIWDGGMTLYIRAILPSRNAQVQHSSEKCPLKVFASLPESA